MTRSPRTSSLRSPTTWSGADDVADRYVLDTSTASRAARDRGSRSTGIRAFVEQNQFSVTVLTLYELHRGLLKLESQAQGRRKRIAVQLFLQDAVEVLDPSTATPSGWDMAASIWAHAALSSPAIVFGEMDLLISATAFAHGHTLVTSDRKLADRLVECGYGENVKFLG